MSSFVSPCRDCPNAGAPCRRQAADSHSTIVLDYPTHLEAKKGLLLQGDTGRLIKATINSLGANWNEFNFITALNCKPSTTKAKEKREAVACCRARLLRELRSLHTQKVLCLGPLSYMALTSSDRFPRTDKVHGRWLPVYGMQLLGSYSPTRVLMDPDFFRDFQADIAKFVHTDGREPWPDIRMYVPNTTKQLLRYMKQIGAFGHTTLSCDIETDGFNPIDNHIIAIGFASIRGNTAGDVVIINQNLLEHDLTWMYIADQLDYGSTAFHNAKFDLKFLMQELRKRDIGYELNNIEDTLLLNYSRDERPIGRFGAHSLKNINRFRYDAPDYDIGVGKWLKQYKTASDKDKRELVDRLHKYLALDCYYTARLARDLRDEVEQESERLIDFYEWLLIPGTIALAEIELRGCKLDRPYLEKLDKQLERHTAELLAQIREQVGNEEFNPGSQKQMHKLLYHQLGMPITKTERKGKVKEGPTSQPVIRILRSRYSKHAKLLNLIIEWRQAMKVRGTYVTGLLSRIDSDNRIRGNFNVTGTSTGRLSSSDPNLQNIPEKSHLGFDIRRAFVPSHSHWVMIEADFEQLELRVAAHLSQDENLVSAYIEGRDLHQDVSDAVYQKKNVTPWERRLTKTMVFGALYGRGAASLAFGPEMEYLETELGGKRWTLEQTETFFKRFYDQYPQLREWQEQQRAATYKNGTVETDFGRIRRFPFVNRNDEGAVGRQGMNMPIQSMASDITFSALVRVHERLAELNDDAGQVMAHILLTVHDSILVECDSSCKDLVVRIITDEMQRVPIESNVPFKVKIKVGAHWGECN